MESFDDSATSAQPVRLPSYSKGTVVARMNANERLCSANHSFEEALAEPTPL